MPLYNPIELSDPILTWVTGTSYGVGDDVVDSSKLYSCLIAHTSGTFATDLGASKWGEIGAGVTSVGTAGTINRGGGAGGGSHRQFPPAGSAPGGAGGSGIVILRYKFQ